MSLDPQDIHDRLRRLAARDRSRVVFGAMSHKYALNPPLDAAVLDAFDREHEIVLPHDYRHFLTHIGDGGAGPWYGVNPFGHDDDGRWEDTLLVGDVGQPFRFSAPWNLSEEFWESDPRGAEGISLEDEDRLVEEWDRRENDAYWNPALMNGAIPISHLGCALRQWLVVHGPQRGFIWNDFRADQRGLSPVSGADGSPLTFTAWYLAWLAEAEQKVG